MSLRCVDLFAGAGGFSEGARQAGAQVLWAGNHWPAAVAAHSHNHPHTEHACQDLHQADWRKVPPHDLLLAAPACQGHTDSRGAEKPYHEALRCTAYAVLGAADYHRPEWILVENVWQFQRWDGYRGWRQTLEDFGYHLTTQVLDSAEFGVPQQRRRLFILGSRRRALPLLSPMSRHIPASTFVRYDQGDWSPVRRPGRAPKTLARWERGRRQFGERFLLPYYGSARTGRSLHRPCGTITTVDRFGVVDGERMRMLSPDECRQAMGFPEGYRLPEDPKLAVHLLGNAVCPPVAAELVRQIQAVA